MHNVRLLGLAIRARWLGFAELDAKKHLLDWGLIFYQRRTVGQLRSVRERIGHLLVRMNPSFVIVVLPGLQPNEEVAAVRSVMRAIRAAASSRSIQIIRLNRNVIRASFGPRNAMSKHKIAVILARGFPELSWKLPPARKIWAKEDSRMAIFDALAGAVAYQNCGRGSAIGNETDEGSD